MTAQKKGAGRRTRPAPAVRPTPRAGLAPTIAAVAAVAVIGGYVFVSATFTGPPSPARAAVSDAFAPYFSQRWDVFAPDILRVNRSLQIQAQWRDDSEDLVKSEWVDVTGTELDAVSGSPAPSRISKNSQNALGDYLDRYWDLTDAQQERARDTFIEQTDDGFAAISDADLLADFDGLGDDSDAVVRFVRYDYMLTRFSTVYADAFFGEPIERVRWRVQTDRPNDFDHRLDEARQYETTELTFGWRQAEQPDDDSVRGIFADVQSRYDAQELP
ncbi:DUF5819 family protein [Microbacterium testaceum]|uniref:DUF5819 family protein n=1 Tax=Microbacterium testaceum TaxID=2033 RepID=UPI00178384F1|nr:DUF5819 family protein [Microbacterium testaceum]